MAPHSSALAWKIPWTEEPGGLRHGVAQSRTRLKRLSSSRALLTVKSGGGGADGTWWVEARDAMSWMDAMPCAG